MIIEIEPDCECECQKQHNNGVDHNFACNDPLCNYHGKLVCGACECCGDFFGPNCICTNRSMMNQIDPELSCRKPYTIQKNNATITRYEPDICSGKGECDECGKCICPEETESDHVTVIRKFSGPFCDIICDNTNCDRDKNGRLCGGCGICECGVCKCDTCGVGEGSGNAYYGTACEHALRKCRSSPDDQKICSGNGLCQCDECECDCECECFDRYQGKVKTHHVIKSI